MRLTVLPGRYNDSFRNFPTISLYREFGYIQENMREQRGTLRTLAVIVIVTKVIFSFLKSVFRDDYNLDLRFLVKIKKQISMITADLS